MSNISTPQKIGWTVFMIAAIDMVRFLSVNGGKQ
jgi:hypothetical protein